MAAGSTLRDKFDLRAENEALKAENEQLKMSIRALIESDEEVKKARSAFLKVHHGK